MLECSNYVLLIYACRFQPGASGAPPAADPPQNTIKSQLKRAIKAQAIDEALQYLPQYV